MGYLTLQTDSVACHSSCRPLCVCDEERKRMSINILSSWLLTQAFRQLSSLFLTWFLLTSLKTKITNDEYFPKRKVIQSATSHVFNFRWLHFFSFTFLFFLPYVWSSLILFCFTRGYSWTLRQPLPVVLRSRTSVSLTAVDRAMEGQWCPENFQMGWTIFTLRVGCSK